MGKILCDPPQPTPTPSIVKKRKETLQQGFPPNFSVEQKVHKLELQAKAGTGTVLESRSWSLLFA